MAQTAEIFVKGFENVSCTAEATYDSLQKRRIIHLGTVTYTANSKSFQTVELEATAQGKSNESTGTISGSLRTG